VEPHRAAGDEQADLTVHGGADKAIYLYPAEHYDGWREVLAPAQAAVLDDWGAFGENLTTRGIDERSVALGDRIRLGSALLRVTGPRLPCHKLGLRFDDPEMVKRFHAAGRNGFYLAVERTGHIAPGDVLEVVERHPQRVTPHDLAELQAGRATDPGLRARALAHPALPRGWQAELTASTPQES
jgi:MOSC domain-containing protein YiiM